MTVEAVWLKRLENGGTEIWVKCAGCHNSRMIATNIQNPPEGQPFNMCSRCGEPLYSFDLRQRLIDVVVDRGWSAAIIWLMAQSVEDNEDGPELPQRSQ